jgi:hypothetical protein
VSRKKLRDIGNLDRDKTVLEYRKRALPEGYLFFSHFQRVSLKIPGRLPALPGMNLEIKQ